MTRRRARRQRIARNRARRTCSGFSLSMLKYSAPSPESQRIVAAQIECALGPTPTWDSIQLTRRDLMRDEPLLFTSIEWPPSN